MSPGANSRVSRFASAEARAAVAVALERVVAAQTREREKDAKAAELEMQLGDAQSAIEEMENATRMREMDYDRRVTELRREHSEKEAYLMKLSERVAAQVDALERAGGPAAAAATTKDARASPDAFAGTALASPVRAASADAELRDRRVAALTEETREAKSQNKQLKRRVKALLVEREELEAAAAKLEERLESSGRARARASGTGGAPLGDGSPERSTRRSVDVVHRLARALADASRTAEASGDARGGGGRCGSRVSVEGTRRVAGGGGGGAFE